MITVFVLLVIAGFVCQVIGALPGQNKWPHWVLVAWMLWLAASLVWGVPQLGVH